MFGDDPVAFARSFEEEGANYLHLVDLDGAKAGKLHYFDVAKIVQQTNLFVEVGGGIREEETIQHCLAAGVHRVILGTIAQKDPAFTKAMLKKYGNKIAIGVDAKEEKWPWKAGSRKRQQTRFLPTIGGMGRANDHLYRNLT